MELPWDNALTALRSIEKNAEGTKPLTDTGSHFRAAATNLRRRIEEGDRGPLTAAMLGSMRTILGGLGEHKLSLARWREITLSVIDTYLEAPDPLPGRVLMHAFHTLVSHTQNMYTELWGTARDVIPDPHVLADSLGILSWDFPATVRVAKERAVAYYELMEKRLAEQSKELKTTPNALSIAAETIRYKRLNVLDRIPDGQDISDDTKERQFFDGTALLLKGIDSMCTAVAVHLYDTLAEGSTETFSIPWNWWLYEDPNGAIEHRNRAADMNKNGFVYSQVLGVRIEMYKPSLTPANSHAPQLRGKERLLENTLSKRLYHLADADFEPGEHATHMDAYLFENVACKGVRLLWELSHGPLDRMAFESSQEAMQTVTMLEMGKMHAIYKSEGAVKGIGAFRPDLVHSAMIRANDTPETIARGILEQWLWSVNYRRGGRAEVQEKEVAPMFLEKHDITIDVRKMLGSRPLLNMYVQMAQSIINQQNVGGQWLQGALGVDSRISSDKSAAWTAALHALFFETAFMQYSAERFMAFPEELVLSVEQVRNDVHFLAHRTPDDMEIREAQAELDEESYDNLRSTLMNVSGELSHGELLTITRAAALSRDLSLLRANARSHTLPQDLTDLLDDLNERVHDYNRKHVNDRVSAETEAMKAFAATATNEEIAPDNAYEALEPLLEKALSALRKNTGKPPLPLLYMSDKAELGQKITEHVVMLRMHGGAPDTPCFEGFNDALYLLACMVRRHSVMCARNNISVLRTSRIKLSEVLDKLRERVVIKEPLAAEWWDSIKEHYFERTPMADGWDEPAFMQNWLGKDDIAFIVTLRKCVDALSKCALERFSEWLGKVMYACSHEQTAAAAERAMRTAFSRSPEVETIIKRMHGLCSQIGPILSNLRALESKIAQNAAYTPTDGTERALYAEIHKQGDVVEVVASWERDSNIIYHQGELRAAFSRLNKETKEKAQDLVENVMSYQWDLYLSQ